MSELILVSVVELDFVVLEQILAAGIGEDEVNPAHVVAAHVRAEHDAVRGVTAKALGIHLGQELDVATAAERVLALLVLDGELNDEILATVGERLLERSRDGMVLHVGGGLNSLVIALVNEPVARGPLPFAEAGIRLPLARCPA